MPICLQKLIPQHLLSRLMGVLGNCRCSIYKNAMIKQFIRIYGVNMQEAVFEQSEDYSCFNDFFTRHLKPEVRDICRPDHHIISPADGIISECGMIQDECLLQAKGVTYSLEALLASAELAKEFDQGHFMTIYLSPKDYHRVHMPYAGKLVKMIYVPGSLFSVNEAAVSNIPGLFARNERVICLFETEYGMMAVILVGALIVGSIYTTWHGCVTPSKPYHLTEWDYESQDLQYERGDELGFFQMGSTVITLFPKNSIEWISSLQAGSPLQLGNTVATLLHF